MNCPNCGNEMWDNRGNKRNPKSPDFRCKNKQCGRAIWPERSQATSGGPARPQSNGGGKWTWGSLSEHYRRSLLLANKHVAAVIPESKPEHVIAAAATIFIAATRDGVKSEAPKAPPPPPPPEPSAPDVQDDELPW